MSVKYRIKYNDIPGKKHTHRTKAAGYLPTVLLGAALIMLFFHAPDKAKIYEFFLPGNPNVTSEAFTNLSEALDQGSSITSALDVFCHTIMDGE